MRTRRVLTCAALVAAAWAVPAGVAIAGKPSGGGGTTQPGTIYLKVDGASLWSMNGDGGAKTYLTPGQTSGGDDRASRLLHGGKRWFLRVDRVPGEVCGWRADGARHDLFAVREDGALAVRLTSDPLMDYKASWGWCPDESASGLTIAGTARRWTGTSSADTVVAGTAGLYAAHLAFDAAGNVAGLDATPSFVVPLGTVQLAGGEYADARSVSWAPDMSRLVSDRIHVAGQARQVDLRVIDVATGAAAVIVTASYVRDPEWSPDGSKIAFTRGDASGGTAIETVTPDGGVRRTVATGSTAYDGLVTPRFSPDSAWIAFAWQQFAAGKAGAIDVFRVGASGGKAVNLTRDVDPSAGPIDWR